MFLLVEIRVVITLEAEALIKSEGDSRYFGLLHTWPRCLGRLRGGRLCRSSFISSLMSEVLAASKLLSCNFLAVAGVLLSVGSSPLTAACSWDVVGSGTAFKTSIAGAINNSKHTKLPRLKIPILSSVAFCANLVIVKTQYAS